MATDLTARLADNYVPGKYRGVAVSRVDIPLDADSLTAHLLGRTSYRRTRFVVVCSGADTAIARVWRDDPEPLFSPISRVEVLATAAECRYVHSPDTDTAVPSALAEAARRLAPESPAVAVEGLYQHVSFIINPKPLRVVVRELTPPDPAKLFDQARRMLAIAEDLPPIELVPDLVSFADVAAGHPAAHYLVPCRGSGFEPLGAQTSYLDEHPPDATWTLLGPERSLQIHREFYGHEPDVFVDVCPDNRPPIDGPLLSKCSLLEHDMRVSNGQVTVPWGSSLSQVGAALHALADAWEPTWEPV